VSLPPGRADVLRMLAAFGDRSPESVPEELGSLELTWLIAEFEQQYGVEAELSDDRLDAVRSVDDAVELLREACLAAVGSGADTGADPGAARS
jgi:hypothetical protein